MNSFLESFGGLDSSGSLDMSPWNLLTCSELGCVSPMTEELTYFYSLFPPLKQNQVLELFYYSIENLNEWKYMKIISIFFSWDQDMAFPLGK